MSSNEGAVTDSESLTTNNGTWINWGRLVTVAIGFLSTVWYSNIAQVVGSVIAVPVNLARSIGDQAGRVTEQFVSTIPVGLRASFQPAADTIGSLGAFALPAAVLVVTLVAYVVARGLNDG
ncbi:hypothetical protein [Haloplanus salilacus]|uniref:hypothetical protein n=1 Tax=Haloplanus salilacus TaxID=2949994 RepID=UPI0030D29964